MFAIPPPPLPQYPDSLALGVAGPSVVVGVLLLLWGRSIHRALLCGVGMIAGLVLAVPAAERFGINLTAARLTGAIVLGLLGLIMARPVWAGLAAVLFGSLAECVLLWRYVCEFSQESRPVFETASTTFTGWVLGAVQYHLHWTWMMWQYKPALVLGVVCPAVLLPLVISIIRDRMVRIVMTSLLGGGGAVFGTIFAIVQLQQSFWPVIWTHWYVPCAIVIGLGITGIVLQYRGALREDKQMQDRQDEETETSKKQSVDKADKKK